MDPPPTGLNKRVRMFSGVRFLQALGWPEFQPPANRSCDRSAVRIHLWLCGCKSLEALFGEGLLRLDLPGIAPCLLHSDFARHCIGQQRHGEDRCCQQADRRRHCQMQPVFLCHCGQMASIHLSWHGCPPCGYFARWLLTLPQGLHRVIVPVRFRSPHGLCQIALINR